MYEHVTSIQKRAKSSLTFCGKEPSFFEEGSFVFLYVQIVAQNKARKAALDNLPCIKRVALIIGIKLLF
jgi:hypothetical protein